ncbi:MAG TPA: hypothetical protein VF163_01110 [Micromonosporaceae bacterium]
MAMLYRADLAPSKVELLAAWLPTRAWFRGRDAAGLVRLDSYRFDDPDGQVGLETLIVRAADGAVLHLPLTYRAGPLDGADAWLLGTAEHSTLGPRWIYDACGDPVYASVLANVMFTGAGQADEFFEVDGELERREVTTTVRGSGAGGGEAPAVRTVVRVDDTDPTVIHTDSLVLAVARVLAASPGRPAWGDGEPRASLAGTWAGQPDPRWLAEVRAG